VAAPAAISARVLGLCSAVLLCKAPANARELNTCCTARVLSAAFLWLTAAFRGLSAAPPRVTFTAAARLTARFPRIATERWA